MRKIIAVLATVFLLSNNVRANDSTKYYEDSFQQLKAMLEAREIPDFEKAVYLSEAPYWDNIYTYERFQELITLQANSVEALYRANDKSSKMDFSVKVNSSGRFNMDDLQYTEEEKRELYINNLKNWAVFTYITDTTITNGVLHFPILYSSNDPFGMKDWRFSQVINTFGTEDRSGNCYALTAFYKILANRLDAKSSICTAPQHIYIQHFDEEGDLYNVELATAGHPSDGELQTLTNVPSQAIKSGVALRSYSDRELIGLLLVNLAKSYERKFKTTSDDFLLKCADLALSYDSLNLNALLLRQQVLDNRVYTYAINGTKEFTDLKSDNAISVEYNYLQKNTKRLYELGYRPMPTDMQRAILDGFSNSQEAYLFYLKDKNPKPFTTIKPLKKEDEAYISISNGLFQEVWQEKEQEIYGHFVFETASTSLIDIETENFQRTIIDPVAFAYDFGARIYDSRVGRWISRDPLAHKFSSWSPYNGFNGNPIYYTDPDGKAVIPVTEASKNRFQGIVELTFGTYEDSESAIGSLIVSQMEFINSIHDGVAGQPYALVTKKEFKKALRSSGLSDDLKAQATDLYNAVSNGNKQMLYIDENPSNLLPEFFDQGTEPSKLNAQEQAELDATGVTSRTQVGSEPMQRGIQELGGYTVQQPTEGGGTSSENSLLLETVISSDKKLTKGEVTVR